MGRKILLTGGAGYIGSHTFVSLVEAGYDVVILDNFSNAKRSVLDRLSQITTLNDICCYVGSVEDGALLQQIFSDHRVDAVIHFAAKKSIGESVSDPLAYMKCNLSGLIVLLQEMKAARIAKLVFSSSATVYGDSETQPIAETAPRGFSNPYGFTKLAGEQILEQANAADKWAFGILRYFNPVGAHPSGLIGEDPTNIPNNLMPYVAQVASGILPHLSVFGDDYPTRDGTGVRDYIHVSDLADGHVASLNALFATDMGHTVNLGTGQGTSVFELVTAYAQASGRPVPCIVTARRPGDVAECVADPTLARHLIGFNAQRGLEEMCVSSWKWITTSSGATG